ncbi:hypothetical protein MKW98_015752 [Papaver atlanticum]|uniref:Late embryogenesis abundant protein Lea5 n=1 Tax=Papaver atlanticum TaxID=357466 RepID=A0AAD4SYG0_9MAGN|nr:hypothetical protein MKW98_015752 [Papaver atlanticum]
MARSLSNIKFVLTALIDGNSPSVNRSRGVIYIATKAVGSSVVREEKMKQRSMVVRGELSPWVPCPITGYYRPEHPADYIDVAEFGDTLLNQKINHHSKDTNTNKVL